MPICSPHPQRLATMSDFPDLSSYGYHIEKQLGANWTGGRVTYLATASNTHQPVVIKQFQFARSGSAWSGYDLYKREIEVLQGLNHPGIPRYLGCFQTETGFCMVQEFKSARPLSTGRSFSPDHIRQIAVSALEILVYLQNQIPPVIHRDIKPENVLVDDQMRLYLVDFGFARVGDGEVGVSSVVKGTLGFMPPEQLFNRQLTEASDLYGLGLTLICLLTKTKSIDIGNLVDISYRVSFRSLLPKLSLDWLNWLEKMVEPKLDNRFANAMAALEALPSVPLRLPEAKFSQAQLNFTAAKLGEQLTQTVHITNLVPETVLTGRWEVAPHPSDPPHTQEAHSWISFQPAQFKRNQIDCQISVNTYKLMADKLYQRTIFLHTNSCPKTYSLLVQVQTAPIPIRSLKLPYSFLALIFLGFSVTAWGLSIVLFTVGLWLHNQIALSFGVVAGSAVGFQIAAWMLSSVGLSTGELAAVVAGATLGVLALSSVGVAETNFDSIALAIGAGMGLLSGVISGVTIGNGVERLVEQGLGKLLSIGLTLATATAGFIVGICLTPHLINPVLIATAVCIGALWGTFATYLPLQRKKLIAAYRQYEQHLIRP